MIQSKDWKIPPFKQGDVVEVEYYYSLSEKQVNTVKGLCISKSKPNSLHATLGLCFWADDTIVYWKIKALSPIVKNIKIVAEGSKGL